jgi:hypothetical protein
MSKLSHRFYLPIQIVLQMVATFFTNDILTFQMNIAIWKQLYFGNVNTFSCIPFSSLYNKLKIT